MTDKLTANLAAFEQFLAERGWQILGQEEIEHGRQLVVTNGAIRLPVNFYHTGKIVPQGKPGEMKTAITEWSNLLQAGLGVSSIQRGAEQRQNRIAKYLVIPDKVETIRNVVLHLPSEVITKDPSGPAEVYRVEVRQSGQRVTISQYASGTLLVQGLSGQQFDRVCEALDEHLTQSFSARASRFIPGEAERAAVTPYLEGPEAENEATRWLLSQIDKKVLEFLYPSDQRTLLSAAGVRNAFQKTRQPLPDYSVIVMPFAKPYEGFLIRLATHLELTSEDALTRKASTIDVAAWLEAIKTRLPDTKRYSEVHAALEDGWGCRNKAMHSDFAHPLSVLKTFQEAEMEIVAMLRGMSRAYRVFVEEGVKLQSTSSSQEAKPRPTAERPAEDESKEFKNVDRKILRKQLEEDGFSVVGQPEGRKHEWEILNKPDLTVIAPRSQEGLVIVKGKKTSEFVSKYKALLEAQPIASLQESAQGRIGVDESGKGDVFGPLVTGFWHVLI